MSWSPRPTSTAPNRCESKGGLKVAWCRPPNRAGTITYVTGQPPGLVAPANAWGNQIVSTRNGDGWSSQDISLPNSVPFGRDVGNGSRYRAFSADLSSGLAINGDGAPVEEAPLDPLAPAGYENDYLRDNQTGGIRALLESFTPETPADEFRMDFVAASSDLKHVVVTTTGAPTPEATEGGLYESAAGGLQAVSVLPDGTQEPGAEVGTAQGAQPVSADGSRVVWVAGNRLYMRKNIGTPHAETVEVDAPEEGVALSESPGGEFVGMSSDGSRVFFMSHQRLTSDSTASERELYEFDVNTGHLSDLTVDSGDSEGAGLLGVLGVSEDGSYVYFVANGVLAANASPGSCAEGGSLEARCNLYVWHEGSTRFIATLSGEDGSNGSRQHLGVANDWQIRLWQRTARVSPDGRSVVFMSRRSLTGYDNTVSSGNSCGQDAFGDPLSASCEEVFHYDAASEQLTCVSCDPSGARPSGTSGIPAGTPYRNNRAVYVSRVLSSSGARVFFESADALVPGDTNGTVDVYQWEEDGEGDCRREAGCVSLISSGKDSGESKFLDASADGSDVFFLTRARLVSEDFDSSYDVYDAHVCGSHGWPCLLGAPVSPPPCSSGDGCRPSPSPQPSVFGAPASATFSGAGNLTPTVSRPAVKPLTNAQKLAKAVKACRAKHSKSRRRVCESQARRRYGRKSKKSVHTNRTGK